MRYFLAEECLPQKCCVFKNLWCVCVCVCMDAMYFLSILLFFGFAKTANFRVKKKKGGIKKGEGGRGEEKYERG